MLFIHDDVEKGGAILRRYTYVRAAVIRNFCSFVSNIWQSGIRCRYRIHRSGTVFGCNYSAASSWCVYIITPRSNTHCPFASSSDWTNVYILYRNGSLILLNQINNFKDTPMLYNLN